MVNQSAFTASAAAVDKPNTIRDDEIGYEIIFVCLLVFQWLVDHH